VGGQLGLEHMLKRRGEQPGKDAVFAEEVVDAFGAGQLLLDALQRGHQYDFLRWLRCVRHSVTSFLTVNGHQYNLYPLG